MTVTDSIAVAIVVAATAATTATDNTTAAADRTFTGMSTAV